MEKSYLRLVLFIGGLLAAAPLPGCASSLVPASQVQTAALTEDAKRAVGETLAAMLGRDYADPELGGRMALRLRDGLSTDVYEGLAAQAFAAALERDLREVSHDLHLEVKYAPAPDGVDESDDEADEAESLRKSMGGLSRLELFDEGAIGYVALYEFDPPQFARPALDAIFGLLANTDALIIDLRENGGGSPPGVALVAGYLVGSPQQVLNTIHIRPDNQVRQLKSVDVGTAAYGATKPIYVLVSNRSFSGAEALAYHLQAMKRSTIIGEATRGGGNITRPQPLGHDFIVIMPFARVTSPITGAGWEGVGVRPDVPAPADKALDLSLQKARSGL